jgi:hypothetical protein
MESAAGKMPGCLKRPDGFDWRMPMLLGQHSSFLRDQGCLGYYEKQ